MNQDNFMNFIYLCVAAALGYFGYKKIMEVEANAASIAAANNPGPAAAPPAATTKKPAAPKKAPVKYAPTKTEAYKPKAFGNDFGEKIQQYAERLNKANEAAKAFANKLGTTPFINTTVNAVLNLPDSDFKQVFAAWKMIVPEGSVLGAALNTAKIDNIERTRLFFRAISLKAV